MGRVARLGAVAVVVGLATVVGAMRGDEPRVKSLFMTVELAPERDPHVEQVIDVDFGGVGDGKHVDVGDGYAVTEDRRFTRKFVPKEAMFSDRLWWQVAEEGWDRPIEHAEVHLISNYAIDVSHCMVGRNPPFRDCDHVSIDDGYAEIDAGRIGQGEYLSITARLYIPLDSTLFPLADSMRRENPPPPDPPADAGTGLVPITLVGVVATIAAGVAASRYRWGTALRLTERRRRLVLGGGAAGLLVVTWAAARAAEQGPGYLLLVALGALLAGAAVRLQEVEQAPAAAAPAEILDAEDVPLFP